MRKYFGVKTSLAALGLSCLGGIGLACFLQCLAMGLGGMDMYPVAIPACIAGGCVALFAFMAMCGLYFHWRGRKPSKLGTALDALISLLLLPGFLWIALLALNLLQNAM